MKSAYAVLAFSVCLVAETPMVYASSSNEWARMRFIGPQGYVCHHTTSPIAIDGHLDEPDWQRAPWTRDFADIEGDVKPKPRFRTHAKMLWDDRYFYVAAEGRLRGYGGTPTAERAAGTLAYSGGCAGVAGIEAAGDCQGLRCQAWRWPVDAPVSQTAQNTQQLFVCLLPQPCQYLTMLGEPEDHFFLTRSVLSRLSRKCTNGLMRGRHPCVSAFEVSCKPLEGEHVIPPSPKSLKRAATTMVCLLFPLFCVGQTTPTLPEPCATNSAAVEAVRAGSRDEASAAWWGFNAEDATECLQAAIDSGAKKVVVPFMGTEWIVRPIRLRGNLELVFEPGVLVLAKKGEFRGKGDSLFAATDAENITLRGYAAKLRMRKKDYQHSPYAKAEWRMTLDFTGCRKIAVKGLRLESSGGDGIYIGATRKQPFCEDVVIRDVTCQDHHRQGISVISAVNLLIENCILSGTGGTAPQAGIDFEPNSPGERLMNCVVRNCTMADNTGAGILVYLNPLSRASEPVSLFFENCLVQGGKDTGIGVGAIKDDGPQGCVEFRNCTVVGAAGGGVYLYDKSPGSARVRFIHCSWKDVGTTEAAKKDRHPPLLFGIRQTKKASSLGGVDFQDCHIYDSLDRPVLVLEGKKSQSARDIQGNIAVHSPFAARAKFEPSLANVNLKLVNILLTEPRGASPQF